MTTLRSNVSFRRLFAGRLVTNVGDSLYTVGAMWLVYELTGSPLYTGIAGFLVQAPRAFQFLVGPLVDRWRIRPVLVATQVAQAVFVLVVPATAAVGRLNVWVVLAVMPALAFLNQFVYPAQSAALPRIVGDDQLVRANSLFSMAYQSSDAIFNAASGLVIATVGAVSLFALNSATFAVAALLFFGVVIPPREVDVDPEPARSDRDGPVSGESQSREHSSAMTDGAGETTDATRDRESDCTDGSSGDDAGGDPGYVEELLEGVRYLRGSAVVSLVLGVMVANAAFGATLAVLPAFADSLGGPTIYGALMAAYAGGLFVGTVGSNLVEDHPYGIVCAVGFAWASVALTASLAVPWLWATVALFFLTFVPVGTFSVLFWAMVQSAVDDALLGRVTSMTSSIAAIMLPLGSLGGGALAGVMGVATVIAILAVFLAGFGAYFVVNARLRRLPPVPEATESALGLRRTGGPDSAASPSG